MECEIGREWLIAAANAHTDNKTANSNQARPRIPYSDSQSLGPPKGGIERTLGFGPCVCKLYTCMFVLHAAHYFLESIMKRVVTLIK